MTTITTQSSYLFSTPSFLEGLSRTLDLGSTLELYNESKTPAQADERAINNDWIAVGHDLLNSMNNYGKTKK